MDNEVEQLKARIQFLEKMLEDEQVVSRKLREQRDEYQRKYVEASRKAVRLAGERNRLIRDSHDVVDLG